MAADFGKPHRLRARYKDAVRNLDAWRGAFDAAYQVVGERQTSAAWRAPKDSEVYKRVADLVPWELDHVQVSKNPRCGSRPSTCP